MTSGYSSINPFEVIDRRLQSIESLLADLLSKIGNQSPHEDDWVESEEAAKMLHWSVDHLYAKHRTILHSTKHGKKILFSRQEIEEYLQSKRMKPVDEEVIDVEKFRIRRLSKHKTA
ncbi:MAG: helix-turn-helix domain-containing protein [Chitinophagaceae bacterium]|nr:helix-turn-helix domain-containing protein [Chitinophagaceae bacterium]